MYQLVPGLPARRVLPTITQQIVQIVQSQIRHLATQPYTTLMKAEQTGKREAGGWLVPSPESQRRSGDITGSRAAVEIYGWQVSDKPFSIKIPLDIVDRLQRDIQYGLGMTTSCDVMGLLIGRIATEYSSTLIIQDYVLTGYTSDNDSH